MLIRKNDNHIFVSNKILLEAPLIAYLPYYMYCDVYITPC